MVMVYRKVDGIGFVICTNLRFWKRHWRAMGTIAKFMTKCRYVHVQLDENEFNKTKKRKWRFWYEYDE